MSDDYGLWDAMDACLVGSGYFEDFTRYQLIWEHNLIWGKHPESIWVGGRFTAKSWTSVDSYVRKLITFPRTKVLWIPGGQASQLDEIIQYFDNYFEHSNFCRKLKGRKWTSRIKLLKNGSRINFIPPTPTSVQSGRANIIHIDEGQLLDPLVYNKILYQAMKGKVQINWSGTALYPSLFFNTWKDKKVTFKMMTPITEAFAENIVSEAVVIKYVENERLNAEDVNEQLFCIWQVKASYAFDIPPISPEEAFSYGNQRQNVIAGIDPNLSPGHVYVKTERINGLNGRPFLVTFEEGTFAKIDNITLLDADEFYIEDKGFNTGFAERAEEIDLRVTKDPWGNNTDKGSNIEGAKILHEQGKLFILHLPDKNGKIRSTCPKLEQGLEDLVFRPDGSIDKLKSGPNIHYVDAWFHSINGHIKIPETKTSKRR